MEFQVLVQDVPVNEITTGDTPNLLWEAFQFYVDIQDAHNSFSLGLKTMRMV